MTVAEGVRRTQAAEKENMEQEQVVEEDDLQPKKRAPARCSKCGMSEHNARTCPQT